MWIVMIVWRQGRLLGSLCFIPLVAIFFGLFYYKEDTKYPFLIMAISGAIILFYAFVMEGSPTGT
jgi:peptidoglycan biosynthesis protein MviN/MurJ (putative lipid II flippase)